MKKRNSGSSQNLESFLNSQGTPNYRENNQIGSQPAESSSRRHTSVTCFTPFNSGRRTMPSKWDDAERWICSPISGYHPNVNNNKSISHTQFHQRRPKSKSGPIGPHGPALYYSNYSPPTIIPLRQGLAMRNITVGTSPFTTGVLAPDSLSVHHFDAHDSVFGPRYIIGNGIRYSSSYVVNENIGPALPSVASAPMWSELLCHPSSPNSRDEKSDDGTKNEEAMRSPYSKRDKGTQMSPPEDENNAHSSPKSSLASAMDSKSCHSEKLKVRDVQVDSQATVIRRSKNHESGPEDHASCLDIADSSLDSSKFQRKEAKIIAWESLQKAKAEAAMQKLEMKLEKKRSSSMDKILNKLRRAQLKAEKMRGSIPVGQQQSQQVSNKPGKVFSFPKHSQICSLGSCFSSHTP